MSLDSKHYTFISDKLSCITWSLEIFSSVNLCIMIPKEFYFLLKMHWIFTICKISYWDRLKGMEENINLILLYAQSWLLSWICFFQCYAYFNYGEHDYIIHLCFYRKRKLGSTRDKKRFDPHCHHVSPCIINIRCNSLEILLFYYFTPNFGLD